MIQQVQTYAPPDLVQLRIKPLFDPFNTNEELARVSILPLGKQPVWNDTVLDLLGKSVGRYQEMKTSPLSKEKMTLYQLYQYQDEMDEYVNNFLTQSKSAFSPKQDEIATPSTPRLEISTPHLVHEFRKVLNNIAITLQLLMDEATTQVDKDALLEILEDSYDHMNSVLENPSTCNPIPFTMEKLIRKITNLTENLAKKDNVQLIISDALGSRKSLLLRSDFQKLKQIMINLIGNAIQFSPKPGNVEIQLEIVKNPVGLSSDQFVSIRFGVRDHGPGISEEHQKTKLFKDYSQAEKATQTHMTESTGLGLSICQKFAKLMGGEIKVNSKLGEGTTFYLDLTFPIQGRSPQRPRSPLPTVRLPAFPSLFSSQPSPASSPTLGDEIRMIVAEDDPTTQKLYIKKLFSPTNPPQIFSTGPAAIEAYKAKRDCNLLMLDMNMPGGLNGWQTAEKIVEIAVQEKRVLPEIMICTGYPPEVEELQKQTEYNNPQIKQAMGRVKIRSKPVNLNALIDEINKPLF